MGNAFDSLNDEQIRRVAALVATLETSNFDFLQLELGDLKLTVGKGQVPPGVEGAPNPPAAPPLAVAPPAPPIAPAPALAAPSPAPSSPQRATDDTAETAEPGTVAVVAPLLGRFYAKPEPGAPPFVTVGSQVTENTTVALIEVMKTFNSVAAGLNGVVTAVCVQDAQLVEYGQVLFRIRPA